MSLIRINRKFSESAWYNLDLICVLLFAAGIILLYVPFGLHRNFPLYEEWRLLNQLYTPGEHFDFVSQWPTRPFLILPIVLGHIFTPGSVVGFNIQLAILIFLQGVLVYLILKRLIPDYPFLIFIAAALAMIYPADAGFMAIRGTIVHETLVFGLIAILLLLRTYGWQRSSIALWAGIFGTQLICLGMYEAMLPILYATPILLMWQEGKLSRQVVVKTILWVMIPTAFLIFILSQTALSASGGDTYIGNQFASGTSSDNFWSIALQATWAMYLKQFKGWFAALDLINLGSPFSHIAALWGGGVAVLAWRLLSQQKMTLNRQWLFTHSAMLICSLGFIFIGYAPYIPTTYRTENWRVLMISSLGSALFLGAILSLLAGNSQLRKQIISILAGIFAGLALLNALNQHQYFVDISEAHQEIMGAIIENLPGLDDAVTVVYVDDRSEFQSQWHMGGNSDALQGALNYIYQRHVSVRICMPQITGLFSTERCTLTPQGIHHTEGRQTGITTHKPYEDLILLRRGYDDQIRILDEVPQEFIAGETIPSGYNPQPYLARYENYSLPNRASRLFSCFPVTQCLHLAQDESAYDTLSIDFSDQLPGFGWQLIYQPQGCVVYWNWCSIHAPEASQTWMIRPRATLNIKLPSASDYQIMFVVTDSQSQALYEDLSLEVNSAPVELTYTQDASQVIYQALVNKDLVKADKYNVFEFNLLTNQAQTNLLLFDELSVFLIEKL